MQLIWRALLLVILAASPVHAAVAFDAFAFLDDGNPGSSPQTFSITLGAGTKGVMVHVFVRDTTSLPTITAVTIGGEALALVAGSSITSAGGAVHGEVWAKSTSLVGAQTVSVTFTAGGGIDVFAAGAISATGVDTGTPVNNGNGSTNTGRPLSLAMTSAAGDLTATALYTLDGTAAATTTQTVKWVTTVIASGGGDIGPGTANPTHQWSNAGGDWTQAVVTGASFKAAVAGGSAAGAGVNGPILKGLVNGGLVQ